MNLCSRWLMAAALACSGVSANAAEFRTRDVKFYSEAVLCAGKLYLPSDYSDAKKSAAVVVAPGAGATQASVEKYAASLAGSGVVAMTFDYRGWGASGGFLYFGEPIRSDDRMRFTQLTSKIDIRRKRIDPLSQTIDIRNALTYLQGEAGVDRARLGVWGVGLAADHAIVVAAADSRVKAFVAQEPTLIGKDETKHAFKPSTDQQAAMVSLARTGSAPKNDRAATAMNAIETKVALAEYYPAWSLDAVPATTSALLIGKSTIELAAAAKRLKGHTEVAGSIDAAAVWIAKALQ
jgi:dienelactone hydrolase